MTTRDLSSSAACVAEAQTGLFADDQTLPPAAVRSDGPCAFPNRKSQEAIQDAVVRLLEETRATEERRWSPRVPFVRPAFICRGEARRRPPQEEHGFQMVSTDISFEGICLLSPEEIPMGPLLLQVEGIRFACDVRWSTQIADRVYRCGLRFVDLLDRPQGSTVTNRR